MILFSILTGIGATPNARAGEFYVVAKCNPNEDETVLPGGWRVESGSLKNDVTCQGQTSGCAYHGSAELAGAYLNSCSTLGHVNVDELGLMIKYGNSSEKLRSSTRSVHLLLQILQDGRKVPLKTEARTVADAVAIQDQWNSELLRCSVGKCDKGTPGVHAICLEKYILNNLKKLISFPDLSFLKEWNSELQGLLIRVRSRGKGITPLQTFATLPPFEIQTIDIFNSSKVGESSADFIRNHGKLRSPVLPVLATTSVSGGNGRHSLPIVGYEQVVCKSRSTGVVRKFERILTRNSWGPGENGPFDLKKMAEGIDRFGYLVTIQRKQEAKEGDESFSIVEGPFSAALYHLATFGDPRLLERFLSRYPGTDLDKTNSDGATPLYTAVNRDYEGVVSLLIDKKADLDKQTKNGWTSLNLAADKGYKGTVRRLIEARANLEIANHNGFTPLNSAASNGNEAVMALLIEQKAELEKRSSTGFTSLNSAALRGSEAAVALLIDKKADLNSEAKGGWTPLNSAAYAGHEGIVRRLVQAGADLERADADGFTALAQAALLGQVGSVRILLEAKADLFKVGKDGRSVLDCAKLAPKNMTEIVALLKTYQALQNRCPISCSGYSKIPIDKASHLQRQ